MNTFFRDLKRGKQGEEMFKHFMERQNLNVFDVREDKAYQQDDIDFIVENNSGLPRSFEIKSDFFGMTNYGNIYLETITDGGNDGWWNHCKADYFVFCDLFNKRSAYGIMIRRNDLKRHIEENRGNRKLIKEKRNCILVSIDGIPAEMIQRINL